MAAASKEFSHGSTLPFLGGVELLRARFLTQTFSRHFHEGFAMGCIEHGAMRFNYRGGERGCGQGSGQPGGAGRSA